MKASSGLLLILLSVLNISFCTLKHKINKLTCENSNIFPQLFKKYHNYTGEPMVIKDTHECSSLDKFCCDQNEVKELKQYWENQNKNNDYSKTQRGFADMIYKI